MVVSNGGSNLTNKQFTGDDVVVVDSSGDGHEAIDDDDDDAAASSHMELDSAVTNDDGDVRVSESERSE
ncbi:hypothetical protein ISN44_As13g006950 [Arabidopsis suecica]|uniref:Uncharacterized protein n=1 Tax=Arabidopsis suecica TaxID=45249 RepID=A0A8T1XXZ9_ARASU|nr:hypothetical protein ISN44_As13g006950 [Arabidopsis suecica]